MIKVSIMSWSSLWELRKLPAIRSTAIWIFLVPIAVKAISNASDVIDFSEIANGLIITLELPFSIYQLYASALIFAFTNIVCIYSCPAIVKETPSFSSFLEAGGNAETLLTYIDEQAVLNIREVDQEKLSSEIDDKELRIIFYKVLESEKSRGLFVRVFCMMMYFIGFLFLLQIVIDNAIFVFELGY